MRLTLLLSVLMVVFSQTLTSCGGGGSSDGSTSTTSGPPSTTCSTADFFHLAVVPNQTVSTATFEVQVIAECLDPSVVPASVAVTDHSGSSQTMTPKTLKWPGTAVDSVSVYSAMVALTPNTVNNIRVASGTKQRTFSIRQKSALSVQVATNSADLRAKVISAMTDPSIDVIEIGYNEPDLGGTIDNAGNGIASVRTTWLSLRPAVGQTVSWIRNTGAPAVARPMVDFLNVDRVTFGSDTADGGAGQFYVEPGKNAWVSNVEFRAKYKITWPTATPMTAPYLADVRVDQTEGQKVYYTDCLWDGTATTAATISAELARDLRFNSHRGDFNQFGKVFLNAMGQDITTVRNDTNTDELHNDVFQIFGNVGTSDIAFKGARIISPNIGPDIQPFLLDRTGTPNYSGVLLDSLIIEGVSPLAAQLAGTVANSRFSNVSFPGYRLSIRQDFVEPQGAFAPTNVRVNNFDVQFIDYEPVGYPINPATIFSSVTVPNPNDVSPQLNAIPGLAGATFSNIKVH